MKTAIIMLIILVMIIFYNPYLTFAQNEKEPEEITVTTYYPAPYGEYDELLTTGNTYLATDTGGVGIGMTTCLKNERLSVNGHIYATDDLHEAFVMYKPQSTDPFSKFYFRNAIGDDPEYNYEDLMVIDNDGNVGIGTTNPLMKLHVKSTNDTFSSILIEKNSGGAGYGLSGGSPRIGFVDTNLGDVYSAPMWAVDNLDDTFRIFRQSNFHTAGSAYFFINNSGNVGIGTENPRRTLDVNGQIIATNILSLAQDTGTSTMTWHLDNDGGRFRIFNQPHFGVAGTERLIITDVGNVGIGTPTPQYTLDVNGLMQTKLLSGNQIRFTRFYNSGGPGQPYLEMGVDGNNLFGISLFASSRRYKENIRDLQVDSSKIYDLRPVNFDWKPPLKGSSFGLIAEEVYEVLPELVSLDADGKPHHVNYELISVLLVNEIKKLKKEQQEIKNQQNKFKEQQKEIETLKKEIAALKQSIKK